MGMLEQQIGAHRGQSGHQPEKARRCEITCHPSLIPRLQAGELSIQQYQSRENLMEAGSCSLPAVDLQSSLHPCLPGLLLNFQIREQCSLNMHMLEYRFPGPSPSLAGWVIKLLGVQLLHM